MLTDTKRTIHPFVSKGKKPLRVSYLLEKLFLLFLRKNGMSIAIIFIDGLLILGLLWFCINYLYRYREYITSNFSVSRFSTFARVLMAAPPLVILIVALLFVFVLKDELFLRFAHAAFLLGMWISATTLGCTYLILMRWRSPFLFVAFLGIVGALLPIILFTSISSFQATFGQAGTTGYLLLLIEGLLMVVCSYPLLMRLSQALDRP
jgi:hypothetical protein